jgi:hypothetical protein
MAIVIRYAGVLEHILDQQGEPVGQYDYGSRGAALEAIATIAEVR